MNKFSQKIEVVANVLIVVVAIVFIGLTVQKYFFSNQNIPQLKSPVIGNKISLSGIDWSKSDKNILLVLQKGCHFCSESAEFYKTLIQQSQGKGINITAVLPQEKSEAKEYLQSLGITGIDINQSELSSIPVEGTPTVILIDNKGEISNVWTGKLPGEKEKEVLNQLIP